MASYKGLLCLMTIASVSAIQQDVCYSDVVGACSPVGGELNNCNAKYGAIEEVMTDLQNYLNMHVSRNFQYLLVSSHFGNYEKSRDGFKSLFKHLSDESWEKAIELAKFIGKRGGNIDLTFRKNSVNDVPIEKYELLEIGALAKALDMTKVLAREAMEIHAQVTKRSKDNHDAEISSWIEKEFMHQQAETIRQLAGHTNDVKRLISQGSDPSLSLFLFDNHLKKIYA